MLPIDYFWVISEHMIAERFMVERLIDLIDIIMVEIDVLHSSISGFWSDWFYPSLSLVLLLYCSG